MGRADLRQEHHAGLAPASSLHRYGDGGVDSRLQKLDGGRVGGKEAVM